MESFPDRPLTTTDLCQQLCVSRRSLFYAFQDTFGVSPMAYYKAKRLSRMRTELKAMEPASTTVARWPCAGASTTPGSSPKTTPGIMTNGLPIPF